MIIYQSTKSVVRDLDYTASINNQAIKKTNELLRNKSLNKNDLTEHPLSNGLCWSVHVALAAVGPTEVHTEFYLLADKCRD